MDLRSEDERSKSTDDASLGQLLSRMTSDVSELFRKEVQLAKTEIKEDISGMAKAVGMFGGTGVAAIFGVLMLSFAAAWGLAALIPTGLAFLVVGLVYLIVAAILFFSAKAKIKAIKPGPEQTVETVKEDVQWAKQQIK